MRTIRLLAFALLLVCEVAYAQYPYVPIRQSANSQNGSTGGAWNTCVLNNVPGGVKSGNLELVAFQWSATGSIISSVISTRVPIWTQLYVENSYGSSHEEVALYGGFATSSGSETITATVTGSGIYQTTQCVELPPNWSLTLDGTASTALWSGTSITSPNITLTYNGSLLLSILTGDSSGDGFMIANHATYLIGSQQGNDAQATGINVATAAGTNNFTWTSNGSSGTVSTIALQPTSTGITFTTPAIAPDGGNGLAYSWTPLATGGVSTYTWSVSSGSLPTGLSINSSTGAITGTITGAANVYHFTLHVTDGTNTQTQAVTMTVGSSMQSAALVQSKAVPSIGTGSLAFTSNVTAGHLGVVAGGYGTTVIQWPQMVWGCTDTLGTQFNICRVDPLGTPSFAGISTLEVLCGFFPSSGADTISCPTTSAMGSIAEISGVDYATGDNSNVTVGINSADPQTITTSSLTTLAANEFLYAQGGVYTYGSTATASSPLTDLGPDFETDSGYKLATTVTGYTASFVAGGNNPYPWLIQLLGFRPAAVAPAIVTGSNHVDMF